VISKRDQGTSTDINVTFLSVLAISTPPPHPRVAFAIWLRSWCRAPAVGTNRMLTIPATLGQPGGRQETCVRMQGRTRRSAATSEATPPSPIRRSTIYWRPRLPVIRFRGAVRNLVDYGSMVTASTGVS
jgi:hypothetical protein